MEVSKEVGKDLISGVNQSALDKAKAKAKTAISDAATKEKAEIEKDNSLTDKQKDEAHVRVDKATKDAVKAIKEATDANAVETAMKAGETAVEKVHENGNLDTVKDNAKKAISEAAAKEKAEIDANNNLTEAQKAAEKAKVDEAQKAAEKAIDASTDANEVEKATTTAKNTISDVNKSEADKQLDEQKAKANEEIEKATQVKLAAIDKSDLSDEKKAEAKRIVKELEDYAKAKVSQARTPEELAKVKENSVKNIEAIAIDDKVKPSYKAKGEAHDPTILDLPKLIITKWTDEEGNELKPADAKAPAVSGEANEAFEHGEIVGYVFVRTETKDDVVTHIFRKVTPTKPEGNGEEQGEVNKPQPTPTTPEVDENINPVPTFKVEKSTRRLANTGTSETNTGLAGLGLAVLGSLLAVAKRRKKDEE